MVIMTPEAFRKHFAYQLTNGNADIQTDGSPYKQVVIYTGFFLQKDGNYSDQPNPEYQDDPTDA